MEPYRPPIPQQDSSGAERWGRNDFLNSVLLMGQVILEPVAHEADSGEPWCYFTMQVNEVDRWGQTLELSHTLILVKAYTHVARKVLSRLYRLDTVVVVGSLQRDRYATEKFAKGALRSRGALCVHARTIRIIPRRGGARSETVRVSKTRLHRLLLLEQSFDPGGTWVSPEAASRYPLDDLIADDEDFT